MLGELSLRTYEYDTYHSITSFIIYKTCFGVISENRKFPKLQDAQNKESEPFQF